MVSKFQACTMSRSSVVIVHKVIGVFSFLRYISGLNQKRIH